MRYACLLGLLLCVLLPACHAQAEGFEFHDGRLLVATQVVTCEVLGGVVGNLRDTRSEERCTLPVSWNIASKAPAGALVIPDGSTRGVLRRPDERSRGDFQHDRKIMEGLNWRQGEELAFREMK